MDPDVWSHWEILPGIPPTTLQTWTGDALRSIKLTSCRSRYIDMRMTFICHSTPFLSIFVMSRVFLPLSCSCHVCICLHLFAALSIYIYVIMNWVNVFLLGGLEQFLYFPYIGKNNPSWLIFFRGVEATNQFLTMLVVCKDSGRMVHRQSEALVMFSFAQAPVPGWPPCPCLLPASMIPLCGF